MLQLCWLFIFACFNKNIYKFFVSPPQNALFFILGEGINIFLKFSQDFFRKVPPQNATFFSVKCKGKFIKGNIKVFKY